MRIPDQPRTRRRAGAIMALGLAVALAGCGSAASSAPASHSSAPPAAVATAAGAAPTHPNVKGKAIKVIVAGSPEVSKIIDVKVVKILRGWGANASISWASSPQVATSSILSGGADVMQFSLGGGLSAVNSHVPIVDFGLAAPRQDYVFITRPNITRLSQLKGKTIGIYSMIGLNGIQTNIILKKAGLTLNQVHVVDIGGQGARRAALLSGRIDASMLGVSSWLKLQPQGFHLLYSYTQSNPRMYGDNLWATKTWLSQHPNRAVAVIEAYLDAFQWFNNPANRSAFVNLAVKYAKGTTAKEAGQIYDLYRQFGRYANGSILTPSAVQHNVKLNLEFKAVKSAPPLSQWVNFRIGQQALKDWQHAQTASS